MDIKQARDTAICDTITSIRAIEQDGPINYDTLKAIRAELIALADDKSLFPRDQFPLTGTGGGAGLNFSANVGKPKMKAGLTQSIDGLSAQVRFTRSDSKRASSNNK